MCARTVTGSDNRSRDHRNEPRVTLKLKLKPTGSRPVMDMLGDTLENVDRGCVYQRSPILRHLEQAADKYLVGDTFCAVETLSLIHI